MFVEHIKAFCAELRAVGGDASCEEIVVYFHLSCLDHQVVGFKVIATNL